MTEQQGLPLRPRKPGPGEPGPGEPVATAWMLDGEMVNASRTTAGLVGDFLAAKAGQRFTTKDLSGTLQRDRGGVVDAVAALKHRDALQTMTDPEDRRRTLAFMTADQAAAWMADGGATSAAGLILSAAPASAKTVPVAAGESARKPAGLRFGVWNDGAIAVEGLARKQLTLPAADACALALLFASFPEGALQALCASPLKPSFSIHLDGRDYPLDAQQTGQLVDYIEQLPSRVMQPMKFPGGAPAAAPGTDNRVHRIEVPADKED